MQVKTGGLGKTKKNVVKMEKNCMIGAQAMLIQEEVELVYAHLISTVELTG